MLGGSIEAFADKMNQKAKTLNLSSTHFVTPHGLDDDNHYTSALDLAILTDYALRNETFSKIVKTKVYTIILNGYPKTLSNTNELLGRLDGIYGVKTGFTNGANRCLVTACKRGDLDIICVVLGCDTKKHRSLDSIKLINYTFDNYSLVNIKDIINNNFEIWSNSHKKSFTVSKGISQDLELCLDTSDFSFSHLAVNNEDLEKISTSVSFQSYFNAPLQKNSKIGKIILEIDGTPYLSVGILNNNTINKKRYYDYIFYVLKNYPRFFL